MSNVFVHVDHYKIIPDDILPRDSDRNLTNFFRKHSQRQPDNIIIKTMGTVYNFLCFNFHDLLHE